ncbi:hypothetical protein ACPPVW_06975 [Leifsonia sp. McL0607]|uniref:hypothetical protein n=1 Tax=Leifsonia sp. McL0607 TaxID=3415672 RepID=UPI003CF54955
MSDTSGLPNTDAQGVPAEDDPERFAPNSGGPGADRDAQAAEPSENERGQGDDSPGRTTPEGAEDVTDAQTQNAPATDSEGAAPPPADFDPAQQPSNPDLVKNVEPPDE